MHVIAFQRHKRKKEEAVETTCSQNDILNFLINHHMCANSVLWSLDSSKLKAISIVKLLSTFSSSTVLKYKCEVLGLTFLCHFILILYYISDGNNALHLFYRSSY